MADHWFFEADLIALRQEWARLMREYGRTGCAEVLARAHEAHARYLERVDQVRSRSQGASRGANTLAEPVTSR